MLCSAFSMSAVGHRLCPRVHRRCVHTSSSIRPYRPANREAMASQPKLGPKMKNILRNITPRLRASTSSVAETPPQSPIPPQLSSDSVAPTAPTAPAIIPPPVAPQKAFVKTKVLEKDIAVLSITYILAENPELKRLIHLIVDIHDKDEEGQLNDILEICARFSVKLASATEAHDHRAEATECITEFIKTVEKVNPECDALSLDALKRMVEDDITKIESLHPIFTQNIIFGTLNRLLNWKVLNPTMGASITILSIVKDASAAIPIPYVQSIIGGVVNLLTAVTQTRSNYDDMRQIAATAGEFVVSCAVICSDRTTEPSTELKRALHKFTKTLEGIAKECDELSRRNPLWRYLQNNVQKNGLQGIRAALTTAIDLFKTESQIHMQLDIEDISKKLDYVALNSLPTHPRYAAAEYLDRSRDDALQHISGWLDKADEAILWMYGAAGLGKSTTAQQLVRLLKKENCLAGGVFLTHLTKEHPETVIQMISRQLGEMHPRAMANIAEAARKLSGPHNPLEDYFAAYIVDPIRQLGYPYQLVVVVDGLEEWTSHESFLAVLAHLPSSSPVKFILSSRPSYSVERVLGKIAIQRYPLPPVSQEIVERYFQHHFEMIDWRGRRPDQLTISRLATHAQGLLIWAATVRSLLSHELDERYPHQILEQILCSEEKVGARNGEQLERLYRNAITTLFPTSDMQEKLRDFLGAMMVLEEPLPLHDFACLLGMSDRVAEEIHRRLTAFQTRGQINSGTVLLAIQQFHISFLEFMESTSTEHNGQSIAISTTNAHSVLADRCLKLVFSEFLPSYRGKTCAHSELRGVEPYIIKFWPCHLSKGTSRLLLAPSISDALTAISDEDMRRWVKLFIPCILFQGKYEWLDNMPKPKLLLELSIMIGGGDATTLSFRLYCLEIAVRLRPIDVKTWMVLGAAYDMLYTYDRNSKSLDEKISVDRHTLQLQKSAGEGTFDADIGFTSNNEEQTNTSGTDTLEDMISTLAGEIYALDVEYLATYFIDPLSAILLSLGSSLYTRFRQWGVSSDLDEAISFNREVLLLWPAPHPAHLSSLKSLGNALLTRYEHQGILSDLDEAILLLQEVLLHQPAPHPARSLSLGDLGNTLRSRFEQWGALSDLDEAIVLYREALVLQKASDPPGSSLFNNLAVCLSAHFEQQGALNTLDEAISLHRQALVLRPAYSPGQSLSLNNLGCTLYIRFDHQGVLSDLDEAILLLREALVHRPAPHPLRSSSLANLGETLCARFEQWGVLNDLDEAISLHQEALVLQPVPHPFRSSTLNNLAVALFTHCKHFKSGASYDLDQAISLHREALLLQPARHPQRSVSLCNLGNALLACFEQRGAFNVLDEAISSYREVLGLEPTPHPRRPRSLTNLANALQTRFEKKGVTNDRDEAISLLQEAEALRL